MRFGRWSRALWALLFVLSAAGFVNQPVSDSNSSTAEDSLSRCKLKTRSQVESQANVVLKKFRKAGESMPRLIEVQDQVSEGAAGSDSPSGPTDLLYEAYFRPGAGLYPLIPHVQIDFALHPTTVIYVCADLNHASHQSKITLYFLDGNGVDTPKDSSPIELLENGFASIFDEPELRVSAASIELHPVTQMVSILWLFRIPYLPRILNRYFASPLENTVYQIIDPLITSGVEKVEITPQGIRFAYGVKVFSIQAPTVKGDMKTETKWMEEYQATSIPSAADRMIQCVK